MKVVVLEDAAADPEAGRRFYHSHEVEGDTAFVYAILDMRRDPVWLRTELVRRK